jgi:hypothetical protein
VSFSGRAGFARAAVCDEWPKTWESGGRLLSTGEKYLAAAYVVVLGVVLAYVVIIAAKLGRLERELGELSELVRRRDA